LFCFLIVAGKLLAVYQFLLGRTTLSPVGRVVRKSYNPEVATDPECRSRLRQILRFFRTRSRSKKFVKNRTGSAVTFHFKQQQEFAWSYVMVVIYCFIRLSQQPEALQKAIALSKPTISGH